MSVPKIALFGKIGHGKTYLLNKLCETQYASKNCSGSCTLSLQTGFTSKHGIAVIDTPGTEADEDLCMHIGAQKMALEGCKLSGVYVVVKFACRVAEVSKLCGCMMDFIGDDDVRIIVTHADESLMLDEKDYKKSLSSRLSVKEENIALVGRETLAEDLEEFILSTLHEPRAFTATKEQVAHAASLSVRDRKSSKYIERVQSVIKAAIDFCKEISTTNGACYERDVILTSVQSAVEDWVEREEKRIFSGAQARNFEQRNFMNGRVETAIGIDLRSFIQNTNKMLSWDISDICDKRNYYKRCNYCSRIHIKHPESDKVFPCGEVMKQREKTPPFLRIQINFDKGDCKIFGFVGGIWCRSDTLSEAVKLKLTSFSSKESDVPERHEELLRLWFLLLSLLYFIATCIRKLSMQVSEESMRFYTADQTGCGNIIAWRAMIPIEPVVAAKLDEVELNSKNNANKKRKTLFTKQVNEYAQENKKVLNAFYHIDDMRGKGVSHSETSQNNAFLNIERSKTKKMKTRQTRQCN